MKLLSLYIDNFGKLSDYKYDFSKTLNTIYEENGWGKTTLTVFIKSMLYGLSKTERDKYTPWKNLTSFGGSLIIEVNNKEYRIERTFNPKRASLDVLKVYNLKTGKEENLASNLGELFLNLNEGSFERSVFIPQKDIEDGFGSDIEAKLANLIGGTNDSQTFDEAIKILTTRLHTLKLNTKKGIIIDKKKELFEIESELTESDNKISQTNEITRNIELTDAELEFLAERKHATNTRILEFSKNQEKKAKLQVLNKYDEDIIRAQNNLNQNDEVFNGHNIQQEEIDIIRNKNKELQKLRFQYEVLKKNIKAPERYETLSKTYNEDTIPSDEEIAGIRKKIDKYNNIKSIIDAHKVTPKKDKPILGIVLLIISSIILLTGIGLMIPSLLKVLPEICMYIGLGLIIASVFGYLGSIAGFLVTSSRNANKMLGGHIKAYDFELIQLDSQIREFFGKFHLYSSDFNNNLFTVRSNIQRYKESKDEYNTVRKSNSDLENRIMTLDNEILHFLGQFNNSQTALTTEEKIGELNTHLRNRKALVENLNDKIRLKDSFIKENNLDTIDEFDTDIDTLNLELNGIEDKIAHLTNNKVMYANKLSEIEAEVAHYDELNNQKENLEAEINSLENEFRLMNLSIDYLTKSQNSLLEKYVKPMKDSVNKYVSLMLDNNKDYSIDVNFKFRFVTDNGLKDLDSYSRGYQSIISLCMRLALIDCLYPNEKPFVIFDDPFVNFDDEKLKLCKNLINDISNHYQIVYFTCHKSRTI